MRETEQHITLGARQRGHVGLTDDDIAERLDMSSMLCSLRDQMNRFKVEWPHSVVEWWSEGLNVVRTVCVSNACG